MIESQECIERADDAVKELECALIRLKSVRKRNHCRTADFDDYVFAVNTVHRAMKTLDPFNLYLKKEDA